ncbi:heat shock-related 70 kDa protein 2-like [Styela clava]
MPAIGIDLGTTYSCVAVVKNGKVEIIANDRGNRVTPSIVSFTENQRLIGDAAKDGASQNYKNTIYQAKRLMGRPYSDDTVQSDIKHWPFEVIDKERKPYFKVQYKNETKTFCPEEIGSMVLTSMRETAEAFIGQKIEEAVITVPAYFTDAQRKATKDAGEIAGLKVLELINEPTAAAIAYGLDQFSEDMRKILIFDLGGGTFDVTVATIKDRVIDVIATGGNTHLGGEDFDNRMAEHCAAIFLKKHGIPIYSNTRAMSKLRRACEHSKRTLSSSTNDNVVVEALAEGIDFSAPITRAKFDDLNSDLFDQTIEVVEKTLLDAKLRVDQIDEIVLVGGSTRLPRIRELLEELFEGKELRRTINPDEAVAHGAAAYASNLCEDVSDGIEQFTIRDVTPLSLGMESCGRDMVTFIPRNTNIPTRVHQDTWTTTKDHQTSILFKVFEGERAATKDNNILGSFVINDIPPEPRGVPKFSISFDIDASGILTVHAYQRSTGLQNSITIENDKGRLDAIMINRMKAEAEVFKQADEEWKAQSQARHKLEDYVYAVKKSIRSRKFVARYSEEERQKILKKCSDSLNWLEIHTNAAKGEIEAWRKDIKREYDRYQLL